MTQEICMMEQMMEQYGCGSGFIAETIGWLQRHQNLARALCEDDTQLPEKDFEEELLKAIQTQDSTYCALLLYQKISLPIEGKA